MGWKWDAHRGYFWIEEGILTSYGNEVIFVEHEAFAEDDLYLSERMVENLGPSGTIVANARPEEAGEFDSHGYVQTTEGIMPEDVMHEGAAWFRQGYAIANVRAKIGAQPGRLMVYDRGELVCTIGISLGSREVVNWVLGSIQWYGPGRRRYDVRYLLESSAIYQAPNTWLPDAYEHALESGSEWIEENIEVFSNPKFGGDGFDWTSPSDWAEAGLDSIIDMTRWFGWGDR